MLDELNNADESGLFIKELCNGTFTQKDILYCSGNTSIFEIKNIGNNENGGF